MLVGTIILFRYYSAIILPSNKTTLGHIGEGANLQNRLLVGAYLRGDYSEVGAYWKIYGISTINNGALGRLELQFPASLLSKMLIEGELLCNFFSV